MSAQLKWILAIGGLLAVNVIACVVLAVLADRGGSEVIPDYYAKASRYDAAMGRAEASRRLGWQVSLVATGGPRGGTLDAAVRDAGDRPIDGAIVRVTGYPRAHAGETLDLALLPVDGHYRAALPGRRGWYDLVVEIDARGAHDTRAIAVEAP